MEGDGFKHDGVGMLARILIVHAIDAGGFGDHFGVNFEGAEGRAGIGGKVGVRSAGGEDDDPAFFKVADGAATDVGFGHRRDGDGRHDAGGYALALEGVLQGQ